MINYIGRNSIKNLSSLIEKEGSLNILVFTGKNSYKSIKTIIEEELKDTKFTYYDDFSTNPKKEEIDIAINKLKSNYDLIIAIGGGSVIDFAKAFRYYTKQVKLVAIPTTCGTGSEATQFAVVYINGIKHSLDDKSIIPDYAIVDSQFVENNPKYLKACTAMDAYCQAIESYWAVKSTEESRMYATQAIELCRDNIVEYVNSNNQKAAEKMALASNLAGKAINISRTTAAHALSYKITSEYGIPHGHAVALSIIGLWGANSNIDISSLNDSRGLDFINNIFKNLSNLISSDTNEYFKKLFMDINLNPNTNDILGFDILKVVNSVNYERLNNNPKKLTKDDCIKILS